MRLCAAELLKDKYTITWKFARVKYMALEVVYTKKEKIYSGVSSGATEIQIFVGMVEFLCLFKISLRIFKK